jgi:tartrate/fumarate subfamily iron-sulfur-dependent hydro-lyase beta chain
MNALEPKFIARFKLACIIGKGGMDARTKEALQKHACCYLAFPGGAAVLAAARIKAVRSVHWLEELGMPEALWVLEVENFGPLVVAMDCHGVSLYETVEREVAKNLPRVEALLGL